MAATLSELGQQVTALSQQLLHLGLPQLGLAPQEGSWAGPAVLAPAGSSWPEQRAGGGRQLLVSQQLAAAPQPRGPGLQAQIDASIREHLQEVLPELRAEIRAALGAAVPALPVPARAGDQARRPAQPQQQLQLGSEGDLRELEHTVPAAGEGSPGNQPPAQQQCRPAGSAAAGSGGGERDGTRAQAQHASVASVQGRQTSQGRVQFSLAVTPLKRPAGWFERSPSPASGAPTTGELRNRPHAQQAEQELGSSRAQSAAHATDGEPQQKRRRTDAPPARPVPPAAQGGQAAGGVGVARQEAQPGQQPGWQQQPQPQPQLQPARPLPAQPPALATAHQAPSAAQTQAVPAVAAAAVAVPVPKLDAAPVLPVQPLPASPARLAATGGSKGGDGGWGASREAIRAAAVAGGLAAARGEAKNAANSLDGPQVDFAAPNFMVGSIPKGGLVVVRCGCGWTGVGCRCTRCMLGPVASCCTAALPRRSHSSRDSKSAAVVRPQNCGSRVPLWLASVR
jgi:hypothetical protein